MTEYISDLPLCPNCDKYSLVYFILDKPKEILIQCNNCKYNQTESLHNYLDKMIRTYTLINENTYCNIHYEICELYCLQCQIYLCKECIFHKYFSHYCVPIERSFISTNNLVNQIKEAHCLINTYCNELKLQRMSDRYYNNEEIENAYQSFHKRNNDILKMIQIIINSYNNYPNNYYFRQNLKNLINTK